MNKLICVPNYVVVLEDYCFVKNVGLGDLVAGENEFSPVEVVLEGLEAPQLGSWNIHTIENISLETRKNKIDKTDEY